MKKEISFQDVLHKSFSTAYCFKRLGYYGSREKALRALSRRKGMETIPVETLVSQFDQALQIIADTEEFIAREIDPKTPLFNRKPDEVHNVMEKLAKMLSQRHPDTPEGMIQFAVNWVYRDYYLR